jgi:hypothetical protein
MKPKETRRERTGSASCFVKRVHDGTVAATVTGGHKPEPGARVDQQLTKTGVLLPQFVGGILQPAGAEVAMEFHLNRPPAFTDDLLPIRAIFTIYVPGSRVLNLNAMALCVPCDHARGGDSL